MGRVGGPSLVGVGAIHRDVVRMNQDGGEPRYRVGQGMLRLDGDTVGLDQVGIDRVHQAAIGLAYGAPRGSPGSRP